MRIAELKKNDMAIVLEYYDNHKNEFEDNITVEEFIEEFCKRCDTCGKIICVLDMCKECDCIEETDKDFEYFDRNKEYYVYGKKD